MNKLFFVILILVSIFLLYLRAPFAITDYPFLFPDSFDWLVNGLQYSGIAESELEISHRGMLVTLLIAFLYKLKAIDLILLLGTFCHIACAALIFYFVGKFFARLTAFWAGLFYLLSAFCLAQSAFLGADLPANLLASGFFLLWIYFLNNPRSQMFYVLAVLSGFGVHTQQIFPILLPTFAISLLVACCCGNRKQLFSTLRSPHAASAGLIFIAIAFGIISPRLWFYHIIYEEKVQHASLIQFGYGGLQYYLSTFICAYSWPIAMLAIVGFVYALRNRISRNVIAYFVLWIANVFVFFALFYSWKDVRFWIYAAVPVFSLAAVGMDCLLQLVKPRLPKAALILMVVFYDQSNPTSDPWDNMASATPVQALVFEGDLHFTIDRKVSKPYLFDHYHEIRKARECTRLAEGECGLNNQNLFSALKLLKSANRGLPIVLYQTLDPARFYIENNRIKVYAKDDVKVLGSPGALREFLSRAGRSQVLIRSSEYKTALYFLGGFARIVEETRYQGDYIGLILEIVPQQAALANDIYNRNVKEIEGLVNPENLFDRIENSPENYAVAVLGKPATITFSKPLAVKSLLISLWDFDPRVYDFEVSILRHNVWAQAINFDGREKSGKVQIEIGGDPISGIQIEGQRNSSEEWIPGNHFLHIKELTFEE